jgi:hypothetical protein
MDLRPSAIIGEVRNRAGPLRWRPVKGDTLAVVRILAIPVLVLVAIVTAGCVGPSSPTEAGGPEADPIYLLNVLPSPDDLRGPPVTQVDAGTLLQTLTGTADAGLAARLTERGLKTAAVRTWTTPDGGRMQAAVSVWRSHLVATGIGSDASARLADEDGAGAWTPSEVPGSRGARIDGAHPERRLAYAVGPNSLFVRSTGDVPEDAVIRTMHRLIVTQEGRQG